MVLLDALPACKWLDGSPVEPEIVRWWVVLACKLKEPGGNALLTRYLGLLDAASRQAVGSLVLRQFIAHDTRHPTLDEGIAHANAHAPQRYQGNQQRYQNAKAEHKQYYEADFQKTQEQVFEECKREKMSEYLGSAIGEKGTLALTAHAPGHEVVTLLQQYMRDHYQRRSQIEAMLEGVAPGNDPVVIQLLLGISRRYRTASVQEKARALVQQIADRNGWTQDQLADRTIPTAGLDDTGKLELAYGDRIFTVVLDAAMKPELRNPEGKIVKALPEPRQNDDPVLIRDAKAQFSTSRKELKQVIDLQTARLFEAMCTGRIWPQAEWREYLHRHPIAGRLIQRLVWLELDAEGAVRGSFRPTEDGSLIDTQDDEVELAADSQLRLGHASLVDEGTAAAWNRHFKDYKLVPLFAQMTRKPPAVAFIDDKGQPVSEINDRLGWISDTFRAARQLCQARLPARAGRGRRLLLPVHQGVLVGRRARGHRVLGQHPAGGERARGAQDAGLRGHEDPRLQRPGAAAVERAAGAAGRGLCRLPGHCPGLRRVRRGLGKEDAVVSPPRRPAEKPAATSS